MNLEKFNQEYVNLKDVDQIIVNNLCDHANHLLITDRTISKQAARRNIQKHGGNEFICRACDLKYNNPMNRKGTWQRGKEQANQEIEVICPHPEHKGEIIRKMKTSCYFGPLDKTPYIQTCGSCAQLGKELSEEQKNKISDSLSGIERSDEFKQKLSDYMKNSPEGIERGKNNLIPGYSAGWNKGKQTPKETKDKISKSNSDKKRSLEQRINVSIGRKKMLQESGGFTREHRENLSRATNLQYLKGFNPNVFHRHGWHYSPKLNKEIFHKSSYEKRAFMILDEDKEVLSYEVESVRLPFWNPIKQIQGTYIVDLKINYVNGKSKLAEIKPLKLAEDNETNRAKIEEGKKYGENNDIEFEVWDEIKLFGPTDTQKKIEEFVKWIDKELESQKLENLIDKELDYYFKNSIVTAESVVIDDENVVIWVVCLHKEDKKLNLNLLMLEKIKGKWISNVIHEEEGPIATCCPLNLLEITPEEKCNSYNELWREDVINFWKNQER